MKKSTFLTACAACAVAFNAVAEGYQVNTLSAKQNGMGNVGTGMHLGAESMIFNPAGMTSITDAVELTGAVTAIFPDATATLPSGDKFKTSNDPSTPLAFNLGMSVYRNLKAGISFYTPYGSGINWGENWPGAVLSQSVKLKTFTVQPTVAWEIIPGLSVGAGAMVTWGTVDLNKGLVAGSSFAAVLGQMGMQWPATTSPASINLNGKASVAVGVNVGIMWDINKSWTVGTSLRTKMGMTVEDGRASVTYANDMAGAVLQDRLNILDQAGFTATMPCPAVWTIGASYRPIDNLVVALDAQLTVWDAYHHLDIEFLDPMLAPYNQHLIKDYSNSWTFKAGACWSITQRFDARLGLMVDTTPVNSHYYNPETPGMTKVSPTIGFSFSPLRNFSIDASLMYTAGCGAKGVSVDYADLLLGTVNTFTADYTTRAWCPSIGVAVKF